MDLNRVLGSAWTNTEALEINHAGDILGQGTYRGHVTSFLLMHGTGAMSDRYFLADHHAETAISLAESPAK
jgi:hypothetical protein